jgi:GTP-binding protein HflX
MKKKIAATKKRLEEVRKNRAALRQNQMQMGLPLVSLVGYTNAGKSSLLNRLAGSNEVITKDRLFETLDPTRRVVTLPGDRDVLLADTVGFVQRLPEQLVAGFKATLEELCEATIILHVIDVSSNTVAQQIGTVHQTMRDLEGFDENTPQLLVFNKVDKLEDGIPEELKQSLIFPWPGVVGHVQISALTGFGLRALADAIEDTIVNHPDFGKTTKLLIPYTEGSWYSKIRGPPAMAKINHEEATADGWLLEVVATESAVRQLERFRAPPAMLEQGSAEIAATDG